MNKDIYMADIYVYYKKKELVFKGEVVTPPLGEYFTRMSTLKKYNIKEPVKIIKIDLIKIIGKTNYEE